jgi:twitching motility protein PilT
MSDEECGQVQPDVKWFCFLVVEHEVVSPQVCAELLQQLGPDADLLTLAQALLDQGFTADLETVQELANQAHERSQQTESVPLGGEATGAVAAPSATSGPTVVTKAIGPKAAAHRFRVEFRHGALQTTDLNQVAALGEQAAREVLGVLAKAIRAAGASDLHLAAGAVPFMRLHGRVAMLGEVALSATSARSLNTLLLRAEQRQRFLSGGDLNLAIEIAAGLRARVNLVLHRGGPAGTYHLIPDHIPSLSELGFVDPEVILRLLDNRTGMIIVAGPVGCGKTTTLAALVSAINRKRAQHIITIEDPVEIVHLSGKCLVNQREVGTHTKDSVSALRGALREDPDVIVIGEMHDLETTELAITAAETGHLVITTLHTRDIATTLGRVLDVFPPGKRPQIRAMASGSMRGIICQQLLPRQDGEGQALAYELLLNNGGVSRIIREGSMHMLPTVMQTGQGQGMVSMDTSVLRLASEGLISAEMALASLRSQDAVRRLGVASAAEEAEEPPAGAPEPVPARKKGGWRR